MGKTTSEIIGLFKDVVYIQDGDVLFYDTALTDKPCQLVRHSLRSFGFMYRYVTPGLYDQIIQFTMSDDLSEILFGYHYTSQQDYDNNKICYETQRKLFDLGIDLKYYDLKTKLPVSYDRSWLIRQNTINDIINYNHIAEKHKE